MRTLPALLLLLVLSATSAPFSWNPLRDGWSGPLPDFTPGITLAPSDERLDLHCDRFTVFQYGGGYPEPEFWRSTANGMAEYKWRYSLDLSADDRSDGIPFTVMIVKDGHGVVAVQDVVLRGVSSQVVQGTVEIPHTAGQVEMVPILGATRSDVLRLLRGKPAAPAAGTVPEHLWHYCLAHESALRVKQFEQLGKNRYKYYFEMVDYDEDGPKDYVPWITYSLEQSGDDELERNYGVVLYDAGGWAVGFAEGHRERQGDRVAMFASGEVKTVAPAAYMRVDEPIYLVNY